MKARLLILLLVITLGVTSGFGSVYIVKNWTWLSSSDYSHQKGSWTIDKVAAPFKSSLREKNLPIWPPFGEISERPALLYNPWLNVQDNYKWKYSGGMKLRMKSSGLVHKIPECDMARFDAKERIVIGRGGQATAFLIQGRSNGQKYIYKEYSKREEFLRESRTASFPDENVIKIVCLCSNELGILMPYLSNGDLWRGFPRPNGEENVNLYDRVVEFSAQLVLAVEAVHRAGYLHHDIKPHNLVREGDRHIELIDFGLSVPVSKAGYRRGTKITMAPEVASVAGYEKAPLHEGLDWWSVGVTIYMLHSSILSDSPTRSLSEHVPYKLTLPQTRVKGAFQGAMTFNPIPKQFPRPLLSLLKRLLHPNPDMRRFSTEEEISSLKSHPYFAKINWWTVGRRPPSIQ